MMNKVGSLNFGQQIIPVKSPKPISEQEKQELSQVKNVLDEKIGQDIISFDLKDANNLDIIINHPDPKFENMLAEKMKEMAGANNLVKEPEAGGKLNTLA